MNKFIRIGNYVFNTNNIKYIHPKTYPAYPDKGVLVIHGNKKGDHFEVHIAMSVEEIAKFLDYWERI